MRHRAIHMSVLTARLNTRRDTRLQNVLYFHMGLKQRLVRAVLRFWQAGMQHACYAEGRGLSSSFRSESSSACKMFRGS